MKFFSSGRSAKGNKPTERRLKIFLCHASEDKPRVRDLHSRLKRDGFAPWLDEEELLPGQDWQIEILAAVQTCDVFLACLSQSSVTKEGFLQKEIARALDKAEEKPEGTIFIIPLRFEAVAVPHRLAQKQWTNIFEEDGYLKLKKSLEICAKPVGAYVSPLVVLPDSDLVSGATPIPTVPPGRVDVGLCDDMTCHLRGAPRLWQTLEKRFIGVPGSEVSFRKVSCLGRCDHAPVLVVNNTPYDGLASDKAISIISQTLAGQQPKMPTISVVQRRLAIDPYEGQRSYGALKRLVMSHTWDSLLAELKASQLQGMGGAGFPTSLKWDVVRKAYSTDKYVICNAHESEPGTIKDRFLLTHLPHLVIEGLALAGLFVGAKRGYLFVRREHQEQISIHHAELERCRNERIIGESILGTDLTFDIELFISPGGYICGEESALVEAIEGKPAQPRNKPPFIAMVGLWGSPTVVNNVETLVFATAIATKGADWFKSHGDTTAYAGIRSRGLKFVGVSGDVQAPGVFEIPMGTTYEDLIYKYAGGLPPGRALVAFAPSGPSSGFLPASKIKLPLDWDVLRKEKSMVGSGAVVVCATGTCMLDMALNAVRFFRNESCGKCVPCHLGSRKLVRLLEGWTKGSYKEGDLADINKLSQALRDTSICGLGQILPTPLESVFQHFQVEVDEHIRERYCRSGVCFPHSPRSVEVVIDGRAWLVPEGTTILEATRKLGIEIPAPCHQEGASVGGCRVCVVELEQKMPGQNRYQRRLYATACTRTLDQTQDQNLIIRTNSPSVQATRKTLLELLMTDHPVPCQRQVERGDCELERLAAKLGVTGSS